MANTIFWIIISILSFSFLLDTILDFVNHRHSKKPLKKSVQGIYNQEKYNKWRKYENAKFGFSHFSSLISFIATILMFALGGFSIVDNWSVQFSTHPVINALLFFTIIGFGSSLLSLPFSIYGTFVIEQKFGFNKMTPKLFVIDTIKSTLIPAILMGGILWAIMELYHFFGEFFWIYAWITLTAFSLFMAEFYSVLIVPLFNKQQTLEKGELRDMIEEFSKKVNFRLNNIFIIDGSKRSTKSNAYFTGLGSKKRIVLYDTLLKHCTNEEIVAILAHEIGHYKKRHIIKSMFISVLNTGVVLYLFSLMVGGAEFSQAVGVSDAKFHIGLLVFGILYSPISELLGIFMNVFSRKNEWEADSFAAQHGQGNQLISGLKKLASKNLSNLNPHPLYVFINYSHPPIGERIEYITKQKQ